MFRLSEREMDMEMQHGIGHEKKCLHGRSAKVACTVSARQLHRATHAPTKTGPRQREEKKQMAFASITGMERKGIHEYVSIQACRTEAPFEAESVLS